MWLWSKRNSRKQQLALTNVADPRWDTLSNEWTCSECTDLHSGIFDLAKFCPAYWEDEELYEPNANIRLEGDFLSEDFCIIGGEYFFIRCVMEMPLVGIDNKFFGYGVWVSASKDNFEFYLQRFDAGEFKDGDGWFGWFSNNLKGYSDAVGLPCDVIPQRGRQRPLVRLHASEHPLALEQEVGIPFERLLEIYELNGHKLKLS